MVISIIIFATRRPNKTNMKYHFIAEIRQFRLNRYTNPFMSVSMNALIIEGKRCVIH